MQFRDLKTQYQALKTDIDEAMAEVVRDGNFISGRQVGELEQALAAYVGVKHCVTCANGTDALSLALMALDIGSGDAVFVPDFTFFASGEVVSYAGATPVFVDVNAETFNLDAHCLEAAVQKVLKEGLLKPKAIIAVDLFGLPANYIAIQKIAQQYNLLILEDGAQGFGGSLNGQRACSFGDIATTSFFPAKPLGCYGDGGAVFTNNDQIAAYIRSLSVHGKGSFKYDNVRIGVNSRLDTLQAAVLKVKLEAFVKYELAQVNTAAKWYSEQLQDIVRVPIVPEGYGSSWAQYTILLDSMLQRNALQAALKERGIPSMVYYPKPMHLQTAFEGIAPQQPSFPVTEMLCEFVLSLPMHPYISLEEIHFVCSEIKIFLN